MRDAFLRAYRGVLVFLLGPVLRELKNDLATEEFARNAQVSRLDTEVGSLCRKSGLYRGCPDGLIQKDGSLI